MKLNMKPVKEKSMFEKISNVISKMNDVACWLLDKLEKKNPSIKIVEEIHYDNYGNVKGKIIRSEHICDK